MSFNNIPPSPPKTINFTLADRELSPRRHQTTNEDPSLTEKTSLVAITLFDDQQTCASSSSSIQITRTAEPQSQLALAVSNLQWSEVETLIEANEIISVNETIVFEGQKTNILLLTIGFKKFDLVELMLHKDPDADINATPAEGTNHGTTPLWLVAKYKQWNLVRLMLEKHSNADINAAVAVGASRGMTPLWFAVYFKQWNLVRLMLEKHPNPDINATPAYGPNRGITILLYPAYHKQWDLVRSMLEKCPNPDINVALAEGPDRGFTPLLYAACFKQWDLVRIMFEKHSKADINAALPGGQDSGFTPLLYAACFKQWDLVRLMLEKHPNADINVAPAKGPNRGITPLLFAANNTQWDLVRIMIEKHLGVKRDNGPIQDNLKKVFAQILASEKTPLRTTLIYYCLLLEVDTFDTPENYLEDISELRSKLKKGLTPATEILLNNWNHDGKGLYSLPTELRVNISLRIIYNEIPALRNLPQKKLLSIITKQSLNSSRLLHKKFLRKMSLLAFREFRWNNNALMSLKPLQVQDARACIKNTLEDYPIDRVRDRYQQIIQEIGKEITPILLNKRVIHEAICRALV